MLLHQKSSISRRTRTALVCALVAVAIAFSLTISASQITADVWDPPPAYYSGSTGTGAALKSQLTSAMSAGHIQRTYGDFRYSAAIHDQDPVNPSNILLVYNRASVLSTWDSAATWNREHVWPDSRQPGSVSNSSMGNLGDPHALRPANTAINAQRGNLPFGLDNTTGNYGVLGSYWFPGDADKGDIARMLFYSDTRWSSLGLSLTDGTPAGNQMGDLSSLIAWHYLDPPDTFERRRNHTIYSQTYNPSYYTNNRNAFVDHPEYVWSIYKNQQNDSSIAIHGGAMNGNGTSTLAVDFGSVIVGANGTYNQSVTIDKAGLDGTYYEISTSGVATSSVTGRHNAFPIGGPASRNLQIGLTATTSTPGLKNGTVMVNNLDITTGGGAGKGANDGNDVFNLTLSVLDHATPSFASGSSQSELFLDFGTVRRGAAAPSLDFDIYNLVSTVGFTAGLELDQISESGNTATFATDLMPFGGVDALVAGAMGATFQVEMDTFRLGGYSATYTLSFSDVDIPGANSLSDLTLHVTGNVVRREINSLFPSVKAFAVPEPSARLSLLLVLVAVATIPRRLPECRQD